MNNVKKSIGWADFTANPVKGLCPVGCSYCYARRDYKRFKWDETIRYAPYVWLDLHKSKPGDRIFVGSTIELFHPLCSMWNEDIIRICSQWHDRTFIVLTKCPENLPREWPDNFWVGVSVTDRYQFHKAHQYLPNIEAKVKFISFEPLLDDVMQSLYGRGMIEIKQINWAIIGLQTPYSKKTAPKIEDVKEIVTATDIAGIPVFLKDNLFSLFDDDFFKIPDWACNSDIGYLRQEFPTVSR